MMRTWSLEETLIRAQSAVAVAMQGVWDVFTHRPAYANDHPIPGCPSPSDCRGFGCAGDCSEALEAPAYDDEVPNPYEPSLSDSELVAVRDLIQQRSDGADPNYLEEVGTTISDEYRPAYDAAKQRKYGVETGHDMGARLAAEMFPQYSKSSTAVQCSGSVEHPAGGLTHSPRVPPAGPDISLPWQICDLTEHYTTLGGMFERPWGITDSLGRVIARIETQAHAEAVVAAVNTDPSRSNRLASVRGEGSPADSGIRKSPAGEQPELDWHGWAEPAVMEVLAEHMPFMTSSDDFCQCGEYIDLSDGWREHVTPILASRLACDPARAIAALHNHKPQ